MLALFDVLNTALRDRDEAPAFSDGQSAVSRREFAGRAFALAATLAPGDARIGLFAPNGVDWAVAQLACALAGRTLTPLPSFFSPAQLEHVTRDAALDCILVTGETWPRAAASGRRLRLISSGETPPSTGERQPIGGFAQIVYTSGSTGQPKGVRHGAAQIGWAMTALADVTMASASDRYLSVLPLPLLLETLCAVFVPLLVGAQVHFDTALAESVGAGRCKGLAQAYADRRPTMSVLVPQHLGVWVSELRSQGGRAPSSLRCVAVGGAPVAAALATEASRLGIPVHEGYGLTECCSVVAVNRPGERRAGTVGRPLPGLSVFISDGEIVVDGPSLMDGYTGRADRVGPWRTGDLGALDDDGYLTVHGRRDNLLVTAFGRNISPEWIETMILADRRVAFCGVAGHGDAHLTALLVPSSDGAAWFARASQAECLALVAACCADAPPYAVPGACIVMSVEEALHAQVLAPSGRISRPRLAETVAHRRETASTPLPTLAIPARKV